MSRRARIWLIVAVLFGLFNAGGAVMAAASGELMHTLTHIAFALLGGYVAMRLWPRTVVPVMPLAVPEAIDDRLSQLEQSVEDVALGVERMGEGQRFIAHLFAEQGIAQPPAERVDVPVGRDVPPTQTG